MTQIRKEQITITTDSTTANSITLRGSDGSLCSTSFKVTALGTILPILAEFTSNSLTSSTQLSFTIGSTNTLVMTTSNLTIQAGITLTTTSTGNINLPNNASARFNIEGVGVGSTVIATNLNTLTNGSNADSLHSHSGTTATVITMTGTSGETINIGAPVSIKNSSGIPKLYNSDANGSNNLPYVIGIAASSVGASASLLLKVSGEVDIPDAIWDAIPAMTDVGTAAYVSETVGKLTITPPSTSGSYATRVGYITRGGGGLVKIIIHIGDNLLN